MPPVKFHLMKLQFRFYSPAYLSLRRLPPQTFWNQEYLLQYHAGILVRFVDAKTASIHAEMMPSRYQHPTFELSMKKTEAMKIPASKQNAQLQ